MAFLYKARDRRDGSLATVEVFSPGVPLEEVREHRRGAVRQDSGGRLFVVHSLEADTATTVQIVPDGFVPEATVAEDSIPPLSEERSGGRIGHYRLLEQLGRGGMGVVYRAEDTRLRRTVALKFLPSGLTRDPVAKSRFLQEAQAASALDHTNICTIYEVGEAEDGELYLTMPCYDGETLRAKIDRGPLPVAETVDLALQIAQGLAKAHRNGIVHRDIKPANLMVTGDGVIKILDFGIAKLLASDLNLASVFAGTPAYMSPEQARGQDVDARTDVWSLGVVLYEMLTGAQPPEDERSRPPSQLRPGVPPELERIVGRMLALQPEERYPTAAEALADLKAFQDAEAAAGSTRRSLLWAAAAALVAGLLATGVWLSRRQEPPVHGVVSQLTNLEGLEEYPSLAPDGKSFVYVATHAGQRDLYWKPVAEGEPVLLTPDSPLDDTQPAFSPDGRTIAFRSERDGGGIYLVSPAGGPARRLTDFGYNPAWSPDGKEIAVGTEGVTDPARRTQESRIWRVDVATGGRRRVAAIDGVQPSWSPQGRRIAFWGVSGENNRRVLWTVPAGGGRPVAAVDDGSLNWNPAWSADGSHLYFGSDRGGSLNLWRVRIDERSGRALGEPQPVTSSPQTVGFWSLSRDGSRIAYAAIQSKSNLERYPFDPGTGAVTGSAAPITRGSNVIRSCDVSPDGQWIAFYAGLPQEDLYLVRTDGSEQRRLTKDRHKDRQPFWSPDGRWLLFYSNRGGTYQAWLLRPDGSGLQPIFEGHDKPVAYPIWAPDGRRVAGTLGEKAVVFDLAQPLSARTPRPLPISLAAGEEFEPTSWSTDGHSLAGNLVGPDGATSLAVCSTRLGTCRSLTRNGLNPAWLRDGHRLLYIDRGTIRLLDARTSRSTPVLPAGSGSLFVGVCLSPDQRNLVAARSVAEGDIWLLAIR